MAIFINEPSHTFNEYLLIPGYSSAECVPANVSLKTPLVKYRKGETPANYTIRYLMPSRESLPPILTPAGRLLAAVRVAMGAW